MYRINKKGDRFNGFTYPSNCYVAIGSIAGDVDLLKGCTKKFLVNYDYNNAIKNHS
jgi:hypothetical protein